MQRERLMRNSRGERDPPRAPASSRKLSETGSPIGHDPLISGYHFNTIRKLRSTKADAKPPSGRSLSALIRREVIERFARLSGGSAPPTLILMTDSTDEEDPAPNPGHPACSDFEASDYCRESWQLHRAALERCPEGHWHKCACGRFCAVIPIVIQDRCLAAVKLACPAAAHEQDFIRQAELLDVLCAIFVHENVKFLGRPARAGRKVASDDGSTASPNEIAAMPGPRHPRIAQALEYVREHLADPKLTVARVARALGIHPHYLSQIYVRATGGRLSEYIKIQRVRSAKKLLIETEWQIKRIARETGHANPNWFCHVFGVYAGLTPGAFRKRARARLLRNAAPSRRDAAR